VWPGQEAAGGGQGAPGPQDDGAAAYAAAWERTQVLQEHRARQVMQAVAIQLREQAARLRSHGPVSATQLKNFVAKRFHFARDACMAFPLSEKVWTRTLGPLWRTVFSESTNALRADVDSPSPVLMVLDTTAATLLAEAPQGTAGAGARASILRTGLAREVEERHSVSFAPDTLLAEGVKYAPSDPSTEISLGLRTFHRVASDNSHRRQYRALEKKHDREDRENQLRRAGVMQLPPQIRDVILKSYRVQDALLEDPDMVDAMAAGQLQVVLAKIKSVNQQLKQKKG